MTQTAPETVPGAEAVDDVHLVRRHRHPAVAASYPSTPRRPLLDDGEFNAEVQQRVGGLAGVGLADGDRALLTVAHRHRDVRQSAATPVHRPRRAIPKTSAASPGRLRSAEHAPALPRRRDVRCGWALRTARSPSTNKDAPSPPRRSRGPRRRICMSGAVGRAVEVQRKIVRREHLAKRHRCRVRVIGDQK